MDYILLLCETSEVHPVSREVFKLVGVDGNQHQHSVGHHQPPKELQQTPPESVVHLEQQGLHSSLHYCRHTFRGMTISLYLIKTEAQQEQQHVDDLVPDQFSSKGDHNKHPSTDINPVFGITAHDHASQDLQHRITARAPF